MTAEKLMNADLNFVSTSREEIRENWLCDETKYLEQIIPLATLSPEQTSQVSRLAQKLVMLSREYAAEEKGLDAFLKEYDLSSQEGVILMCLAEALLRIPDSATADQLIQDKLSSADWSTHLGNSHSVFVNASTWGLMLTGRLVSLNQDSFDIKSLFSRLINRSGEPFIRVVLKEAMHIIAKQFVLGRTIDEALQVTKEKSKKKPKNDFLYSFDMLGESAITQADADNYFETYQQAIASITKFDPTDIASYAVPIDRPGISIKLSALHPRLEISQRERVLKELVPRIETLCEQAMAANIGITIDAEESDRFELVLDVFEAIFKNVKFRDWSGIGIAVQAYQKRALPFIHWLINLAKEYEKVIMLRLVKGAYWDTEIKRAQELGLASYPVYTRKASTDISYLACTELIRNNLQYLYPQFATHNAYSIAAVIEMMRGHGLFEFQALHGMGKPIYAALRHENKNDYPVRIYAPVGRHHDLLPYLVRRLLENGANTSFLNRFAEENIDIEKIITPPVELIVKYAEISHSKIPLPKDMYLPDRINSLGTNLSNPDIILALEQVIAESYKNNYKASCLVNGKTRGSGSYEIINPANHEDHVGTCSEAESDLVEEAIDQAKLGFELWHTIPAGERANILDKASSLLEKRYAEFIPLLVREAGRCIADALSEIREAVDYCRYYAELTRKQFSINKSMPGPTGEFNELSLHGRGVFACISPWNFPLAIFAGQITAALAAGNAVIAKPARQTPLIAHFFVELLFDAGVPKQALHLLLGSGSTIGNALISHKSIDGVAFTGSTDTAISIQQQLIKNNGALKPLIAETGGQNAMIIDSSALPEQVVKDIIQSGFNSAGQRCSALRILFIQDSILDNIITLLSGAMSELCIGNPDNFKTDVGPIISQPALSQILTHVEYLQSFAKLIKDIDLPENLPLGTYCTPKVYQIESLEQLDKEVFGPIIHLIPFATNKIDDVIESINQSGYGLTLGIHSRIDNTVKNILSKAKVGNIYVNRNMIGAVVGVQPFGGEGLSGTGPKAGGPYYLQRFATERTLTINTAAIGGNTNLLSLDDE